MLILAAVVGDVLTAALRAGGDMPAESIGSAGLCRRLHFELREADMAAVGPPPRGAMISKNVSDLKPGAVQRPHRSLQTSLQRLIFQLSDHLIRTDRVADRLRGDMGVLRRRRQLGVAQ